MIAAPTIVSIRLYPIKSLDPVEVQSAQIGVGGNLFGDRRFALFDQYGGLVNGKREPRLQKIRSRYDITSDRLRLDEGKWFDLQSDRSDLETILSDMIGYRIKIKEDNSGALLDDPTGSHMTMVSTATLLQVCKWFGWKDMEEARLRFRANIEINGVPAFWEDTLFLPGKQPVACMIGEVKAAGKKPCPRCPVPARDPYTGEPDIGFQKRFEQLRREYLPSWSSLDSYPHGYHLATTLVINSGQEGKYIRYGDEVSLK